MLLQLGNRGLVRLGVFARERHQALAEPAGLSRSACGVRPLLELGRTGGELDEGGRARRAQRRDRAGAWPTSLGHGIEELAEP